LDEDFCHDHKMFLYDYDKRTKQHVISSRDFKQVKQQLLSQLTNFGQPMIKVIDANYGNRNELLLDHSHEGVDLDSRFTNETLKNIFKVWKRPVHIHTIVEKEPNRISYNGEKVSMEKLSA